MIHFWKISFAVFLSGFVGDQREESVYDGREAILEWSREESQRATSQRETWRCKKITEKYEEEEKNTKCKKSPQLAGISPYNSFIKSLFVYLQLQNYQ